MKLLLFFIITIILSGCGLFDSGSKKLTGEYDVGWIDTACSMKIYRGPLGLMDGQIYHVGWNDDYIIAKQHPGCNQDETSYFIIDINENQKKQYSQTLGVYGPLSERQFINRFNELGIPEEVVFSYKPFKLLAFPSSLS